MSATPTGPPMLHTERFTFLDKQAYLREITAKIQDAPRGERIVLVSHQIDVDDPPVAALMTALNTAAQRGADVSLAIDARTYPLIRRLPLTPAAATAAAHTEAALDELVANGGHCTITNDTFRRLLNPFAGRVHIKTTIISDDLYIGGCNLQESAQIDLMVHWRDGRTAAWLYQEMQSLVRDKHAARAFGPQDKTFTVDPHTTLLLDVGRSGQSTILAHALQLIDDAANWVVMTCQFFPNSTTVAHLAAAVRRGVDVKLYINNPWQHPTGHNIVHYVVRQLERLWQPSVLFDFTLPRDAPFLHAKLLATERAAMIGSHNYVQAGVNFGTSELTLLRYDHTFAEAMVQYFLGQLPH